MGIGLSLTGRTPKGLGLDAIAEALGAHGEITRGEEGGHAYAALALHPAAEPLVIVSPSDRVFHASATTGTAGPGYHAHVCELLGALGERLGITWDPAGDETGYFARRDRGALERATLAWLGALAKRILELSRAGGGAIQINLPAEARFTHAGFVATPLGPRDEAWVVGVADDPTRGIDVFPWWEPGRGAHALRGMALAAMWIDVRWRPPLDARERDALTRIASWLEEAHALDPALELPWREWSELLAHAGVESLLATRTRLRAEASPEAPAIGYRRQPVRVTLSGGWSLQIPGELAERWEDRGTWVGWDATRTIWFNSMEMRGSQSAEQTLRALEEASGRVPELRLDRGPLLLRASFSPGEEEGAPLLALEGLAAIGAHAALSTMVLANESERAWALETWASLHHPELT